MYIITGGAGFIGSALIRKLNDEGITDIIVVDQLGSTDKWKNLRGKQFIDYLHKDDFISQIKGGDEFRGLKGIIHLGACSSTLETDVDFLMENNYRYTGILAHYALAQKVRFIYASSGATYGDGALGYTDDETTTLALRPLNPYGYSKHLFDLQMLREHLDHKMVGLKFFNVFGPNEAHKGVMRSMICKAYEQIKTEGKVRLYRSYRADYRDGEQRRDFIYVKDCTDTIWWFMQNPKVNGLFNLGTGTARSWNDLASACFAALQKLPQIEYIEMPETMRPQYQYFTEARMEKLRALGCPLKFSSLEEGVRDYIVNYLEKQEIL